MFKSLICVIIYKLLIRNSNHLYIQIIFLQSNIWLEFDILNLKKSSFSIVIKKIFFFFKLGIE